MSQPDRPVYLNFQWKNKELIEVGSVEKLQKPKERRLVHRAGKRHSRPVQDIILGKSLLPLL